MLAMWEYYWTWDGGGGGSIVTELIADDCETFNVPADFPDFQVEC